MNITQMKYVKNDKYLKNKSESSGIRWNLVSQILFFIFLLYIDWYKEIWGDKTIILYGSVILLTASLFATPYNQGRQMFDLGSIPFILKVFFLYGVYSFISGIIICVNRSDFISSMITYFCFLLVLFDCSVIAQREGNWDWLLKCLIYSALICCVYTILFGYTSRNGNARAVTMGPQNNAHTLAHVVLMGVFSVTLYHKGEQKVSLLSVFLFLFLSYVIVLTGSRKTLLSVLLLFIIWAPSVVKFLREQAKQNTKIIMIGSLTLAVVLIAWYFVNVYKDSDQFSRLMQLFTGEEDNANESRKRMYQLAIELWEKNPVFGVGFNQYKYYSWRGDYSHSTYGEVLACGGTIGALILFVPVLRYVFRMIGSVHRTAKGEKYLYTMCLAGMITELLLAVGQIWIYGLNHELYLLCILGLYEFRVEADSQNEIKQQPIIPESKKKTGQCRYFR